MYRVVSNADFQTAPTVLVGGLPTTFLRGPLELKRHIAFRGKMLVPKISTQWALLLIPPIHEQTQQTADIVPWAAIDTFLDHLRKGLPDIAFVVEQVLVDRTTVMLLLSTQEGEDALDVVDFVDKDSICFCEAQCAKRKVVAFPCDARPSDELGPASEEFYTIPSCSLCCDRLEQSLTGLSAPVCCCPSAGNCSCLLSSPCAVCRIVLNLSPANKCAFCGDNVDLWVCLVCGFVGCSRYHQKHAKQHSSESKHDFSLSLKTQQIWDYFGDHHVHRLVTKSGVAGAGTERMRLPERADVMGTSGNVSKTLIDATMDTKIERCCLEYTELLKAQLDEQRRNLQQEGRPTAIHAPLDDATFVLGTLSQEVARWRNTTAELAQEVKQLAEARSSLAMIEAEEKACAELAALRKGEFAQVLHDLQQKKTSLDKEIAEQQELNRELKVNLDAKKRIKAQLSREEAQGSSTFLESRRTKHRRH